MDTPRHLSPLNIKLYKSVGKWSERKRRRIMYYVLKLFLILNRHDLNFQLKSYALI